MDKELSKSLPLAAHHMPHKGFHSMGQHLGMQSGPADIKYEISRHSPQHIPQKFA
jgi:hypothetical protein